jgi:hypothetical protein
MLVAETTVCLLPWTSPPPDDAGVALQRLAQAFQDADWIDQSQYHQILFPVTHFHSLVKDVDLKHASYMGSPIAQFKLQQIFDMDEKGATASAGAAAMTSRGGISRYDTFVVDGPFLVWMARKTADKKDVVAFAAVIGPDSWVPGAPQQ